MQKLLSALALLAFVLAARAQVTVEIVFDQEQYLRSESVPLRVKISNFSGQDLRLAEDSDWLNFTVVGADGKVLRHTGRLPVLKPFTVGSAQTVAVRSDLIPFYDLNIAGRYGVSVRLKVPQLNQELTTEVKHFDIISGVKVFEKEVGLPGTSPLVVRKYALQQATFLKETRLYARVTDPSETKIFGVVLLGVLPSSSQPTAAVDNLSQLHVMFQAGQRNCTYAIVTPEAEQIVRQTHEITGTRPRLRTEADGRIVVQGGARKIMATDLPPPSLKPQTNDVVQMK